MKKITDTLAIIPARGGSKGLPGKNIKPLNGKPLILYTIEAARKVFPDENICVSTDDPKIIKIVEQAGLHVPFMRPAELATDTAGSWEVVQHAYDFYKQKEFDFNKIVMLQPTSPFRTEQHIYEAWELFDKTPEAEMIVSVKKSKANPYFTLYELERNGFIHKSKKGNFKTRQECPEIVELNGAIYLINNDLLPKILSKKETFNFPYFMTNLDSTDIDTEIDWMFAELVCSQKHQ